MLDEVGVAMIGEAAGELFEEPKLVLDFAEQQAAGIGVTLPPSKAATTCAGTEVLETEESWNTLCHSEASSRVGREVCWLTQPLCQFRGPARNSTGEKYGLRAGGSDTIREIHGEPRFVRSFSVMIKAYRPIR